MIIGKTYRNQQKHGHGGGEGLEIVSGAYASLERVHVSTLGEKAIGVYGHYSELNGRSLTVSFGCGSNLDLARYGIVVGDSAWATLDRVRVEGGGFRRAHLDDRQGWAPEGTPTSVRVGTVHVAGAIRATARAAPPAAASSAHRSPPAVQLS